MNLNTRLVFAFSIIAVMLGLAFFGGVIFNSQQHEQRGFDSTDIDSSTVKEFNNITTGLGINKLKIFKNNNFQAHTLGEFATQLKSVGVVKDGIPAIDNPKFIIPGSSVTTQLRSWDIVFGIQYNGFVAAYPQRILVWHEVLNQEINGEKISITYCPLTGSTIAYRGTIDKLSTTFGVSGSLINSNLVLYDRATDNYWPQILGQGISKDNFGDQLDSVQLFWSTWREWRTAFPDTLVLTTDTGYIRSYSNDPYGSYEPGVNDSYYQYGGTLFSTQTSYNVIKSKSVVYGIQYNNSYLAIQKSALEQNKIINYHIAGKRIVAFYDQRIGTARVYEGDLNGQNLTFTVINGDIIDVETNNSWDIYGNSVLGQLNEVRYIDVFWFGWIGFFPTTELIYI